MNVIFNGRVREGTTLEIKEDRLFLDDKDIGKVDSPRFRFSTINGEVYASQWTTINGGANV